MNSESAKLRALRALVPYVLSCLKCLLPYLLSYSPSLVPHIPPNLRAHVFHVPRARCGLVLCALWALFPYVPYRFVLYVLYFLISPFLLLSFHASRSYFSVHLLLIRLAVVLRNDDQYLSTVWYISIIWNQIRNHIHMKLIHIHLKRFLNALSWLPLHYIS